MSAPIVLELFGPGAPVEADALTRNLNRLIECVNRLGRDDRFAKPSFVPTVVYDWDSYQVVNALVCDSLTVDGVSVVAQDQLATGAALGMVRLAEAALLGPLTGTPTQQVAAIGAAVNGLLAALRAAGAMAE